MYPVDKYYYLISQLPYLVFGSQDFLNKENFLEQASKWLNKCDFEFLVDLNIGNTFFDNSEDTVIKEYKQFEYSIQETIAKYRTALKKDEDYQLREPLKSVLTEGSPLEVEKKLLYLRWCFIEEIQSTHFFDFGFLILYMLKIQILERLAVFDKEKGRVVFNELSKVSLV
ncbi:MAG: DUF2764 family protein [Candidatus Saelkia tenebricola]|nr:DUF2764 family protein [Candidatus Saelkia tenebricola]